MLKEAKICFFKLGWKNAVLFYARTPLIVIVIVRFINKFFFFLVRFCIFMKNLTGSKKKCTYINNASIQIYMG